MKAKNIKELKVLEDHTEIDHYTLGEVVSLIKDRIKERPCQDFSKGDCKSWWSKSGKNGRWCPNCIIREELKRLLGED